ncbi:unnamed protein product [Prorocentrum cordatum]|uniref:PDZ domain-containing protein n=1 Tax=Prorocentrum cordatum TaxID=2364126 RepID=A0ABN9QNI6_9DINO|nr:unnamed protein product [Polarella glacialis]
MRRDARSVRFLLLLLIHVLLVPSFGSSPSPRGQAPAGREPRWTPPKDVPGQRAVRPATAPRRAHTRAGRGFGCMLEATPANVENAHHDDFRVVVGEEVFRSLAGPAGEPADLSRALASEAPRLWLGDAGRAGASSDLGPGTPLGARPALGGCGPNVKVVSLSKSLECEAFGFTNIPDSTSDGRACLRITEVLPEGLLAAWNSARPQQRLGPGDRIFSVNGVEEDLVGMRDLLCGPTVTLLAETAGGGPLLAAASPAPGVAAPAAAWPLAHGGQPVASPHGEPTSREEEASTRGEASTLDLLEEPGPATGLDSPLEGRLAWSRSASDASSSAPPLDAWNSLRTFLNGELQLAGSSLVFGLVGGRGRGLHRNIHEGRVGEVHGRRARGRFGEKDNLSMGQ